jgi:Nucleoid-associated protein
LIIINKAILHILDFNSGVMLPSEQELTVEDSTQTFLLKHIEKSASDQSAKNGVFYEDSSFKGKLQLYIDGDLSFIAFSRYIVESLYTAISHAEEMDSADIIVCDTMIEEQRNVIIFKCNNHQAFIHQVVQTDEGVKNDIVNHCAIMPNPSQKINEFAFIELPEQRIKFVAPKYTIDGNNICVFPEILLECNHTLSPNELIKTVGKVAKKVAAEYGQSDVVAATAVKSYISDNMQESAQLDPKEVGRRIFEENPAMQAEYSKQIEAAGLSEPMEMDREFTLKKMKNHKLKTDTGIELTIPLDYFNNTDYVEFNNNEDGTMSITLKHIANLSNRS